MNVIQMYDVLQEMGIVLAPFPFPLDKQDRIQAGAGIVGGTPHIFITFKVALDESLLAPIVLHEVGHFVSPNFGSRGKSINEELFADRFAANLIGAEAVIGALRRTIEEELCGEGKLQGLNRLEALGVEIDPNDYQGAGSQACETCPRKSHKDKEVE